MRTSHIHTHTHTHTLHICMHTIMTTFTMFVPFLCIRFAIRASNTSSISSTSSQVPPQGLATVQLATMTKGQFQPSLVSRLVIMCSLIAGSIDELRTNETTE